VNTTDRQKLLAGIQTFFRLREPLIHATWNAVRGDELSPTDRLEALTVFRTACTWEPLKIEDVKKIFTYADMQALQHGRASDGPHPTCMRCLVMVDYRLENPKFNWRKVHIVRQYGSPPSWRVDFPVEQSIFYRQPMFHYGDLPQVPGAELIKDMGQGDGRTFWTSDRNARRMDYLLPTLQLLSSFSLADSVED